MGFGANLGDPAATLRAAAVELGRRAGTVTAGSHIYRSRPVGLTDQPDFRNAVARLETTVSTNKTTWRPHTCHAEGRGGAGGTVAQ